VLAIVPVWGTYHAILLYIVLVHVYYLYLSVPCGESKMMNCYYYHRYCVFTGAEGV